MIDTTVHFFLNRATTQCGRIVVPEAMYVIWSDESFKGELCLVCFAWRYLLEQRVIASVSVQRHGKTIDFFRVYGGIETTFVKPTLEESRVTMLENMSNTSPMFREIAERQGLIDPATGSAI